MSHADNAAQLEQWLRTSPGGYLHPDIHIAADDERGLHWTAAADIAANTRLITTPHSLALSYLNALVDDAYPVFKQRRSEFTIEAIGFFYLMLQHIHSSTSFWRPYLDTLPSPTRVLTTPLWFEDETSHQWLRGTDVLYTMTKRKSVYEDYYIGGKAILEQAGVDTSQFSWDYFKWSITMFTSRSFSSKSIAPSNNKYWTTYKTGNNGQRQTILLDMSHTPAADLDFSVLFPATDAGNHDHKSRVHWDYDPGRFSITALDVVRAGQEVYNNYGPKSNGELLQGYGFCVVDNPNDVVLLTVRTPESLQARIRETHRGYFSADGQWLPEKATFELTGLEQSRSVQTIFETLPKPLLELLLLVIRTEHGFSDDTGDVDNLNRLLQLYRPHIAVVIIQSLLGKLSRMAASDDTPPTSRQQQFASIYLNGQISIITSYVQAMKSYQHSLLEPASKPLRLVRPKHLLPQEVLAASQPLQDFINGIEVNANTSDLEQLEAAGWNDDIWTLLACFVTLIESTGVSVLPALTTLVHQYNTTAHNPKQQDLQQATDLLEIVHNAAAHLPGTLWTSSQWSASFIDRVGNSIDRNDVFSVLLNEEGSASPVSALCIRTE